MKKTIIALALAAGTAALPQVKSRLRGTATDEEAHRVGGRAPNFGRDLKNHNMKLLIALALAAAPSALAMAPYVPSELNGCDEPCADVVTIDSPSFPTIESGTCYVFDGMFPSGGIGVPDGVNCVKITVPSDSGLVFISVFGDNAEIVNAGKVQPTVDGTKITNTGTMSDGNPVQIAVFSPSGAEITVSEPGKAQIFANGGTDIIFKCYGADATATPSTPALCP